MIITQKLQLYSTATLLAYFSQIFAHFKNTSGSLKLRHIIFNKTQNGP